MPQPLTESELIREIKNRSKQGFALLHDRYASFLYKIIWLTVKENVIAERILEDTFLTICHHIDDFQPQNLSFMLWMAGIAKGLALSELSEPEIKQEAIPDLQDPGVQFSF